MGLLIGIIYPGAGSDAMSDPEVVTHEGKRYVQGTVYDDLDWPDHIPYSMNVRVSCILWCEPPACILPDGVWQKPKPDPQSAEGE